MLDSKILFLLENKRANVASFILEEQTLFLLKCIEQNSSSMSKGITASAALFSPLRDVDQYLPYFLSSQPTPHTTSLPTLPHDESTKVWIEKSIVTFSD